MTVGVLPGDMSISVGQSGEVEPRIVVSTAYNVLPLWLRIANDSLLQARTASEAIAAQWTDADRDSRKQLLVKELTASLQVFVSCGIALDALYDQLRPHAKLDPTTIDQWKKNKTARATQISEVIRRVYKLNNEIHTNFRQAIEDIIKFRDRAVHPSLELKNTCGRPDIPVGVDWKFSAYRYSNSETCFRSTMGILIFLFENKCANKELDDGIGHVMEALAELDVVSLKAK